MRKRLLIASVACIVFLIGVLVFFLPGKIRRADRGGTTTVGILNLGPYPLMETITVECERALLRSSAPTVSVKVFNANFDQELLRKAAKDLAAGAYDALVAVTTPAAQALIAENRGRKPLVFTFVSAPAELGWTGAGSLPNVTGLVDIVPLSADFELMAKIIGPGGSIAYLVNDGEASAAAAFKTAVSIAPRAKFTILKVPVGSAGDVRPAVQAVLDRSKAFMIGPDSVVTSGIDTLLGLAYERRIPVFCTDPVSVQRGCLAAVAPDYSGMGQRTADYVLAVLRGTPVKDLAVLDFTDYRTYLNVDTAKTLGVTVPEEIQRSAIAVSARR